MSQFLMIFIVMFRFIAPSYAKEKIQPPCDGTDYEKHSKELAKLYSEDQRDREDFQHWTHDEAIRVMKRDRIRRKRVAEIFSKGCIKSADDYENVATIFQHGEVPDHFYQTYVWAMKALKMGKASAGIMAGNGIDRYLMNLGYKQIYGGQAHMDGAPGTNSCFCLWPIEQSFPATKREAIGFRSIEESLEWLKDLNKEKVGCTNSICQVEAKPTPEGTVPGVW